MYPNMYFDRTYVPASWMLPCSHAYVVPRSSYLFLAQVRQCQGEWLAAGADKSVSCDDFLQQMGYREYSRYLAFHFPFIHERSLLRHLRACPWRIDQAAFKVRPGQLRCTCACSRPA